MTGLIDQLPASSSRAFTIARTLKLSAIILARNIIPFSVMTFLISIAYIAAFAGFIILVGSRAAGHIEDLVPWQIFPIFLVFSWSQLISAALVHGSYEQAVNRPVGMIQCALRGIINLARTVPIIAVYSLVASIAYLTIVIPGLILVLICLVFVPAYIVEGRSVAKSLKRSDDLTRGDRWKIFGLIIATYSLLAAAIWWPALIIDGGIADISPWLGLTMWCTGVAVTGMYLGVTTTASYALLRADKDRGPDHDVLGVFE